MTQPSVDGGERCVVDIEGEPCGHAEGSHLEDGTLISALSDRHRLAALERHPHAFQPSVDGGERCVVCGGQRRVFKDFLLGSPRFMPCPLCSENTTPTARVITNANGGNEPQPVDGGEAQDVRVNVMLAMGFSEKIARREPTEGEAAAWSAYDLAVRADLLHEVSEALDKYDDAGPVWELVGAMRALVGGENSPARHACMFGCGETFATEREAILHAAGKHANNA